MDWEGPIELFKFGEGDDGWVNCTTGYYWHPALGGGVCLYEGEWYQNWEFDYKPPEREIVLYEPENVENVETGEPDLPPQPPSQPQVPQVPLQ